MSHVSRVFDYKSHYSSICVCVTVSKTLKHIVCCERGNICGVWPEQDHHRLQQPPAKMSYMGKLQTPSGKLAVSVSRQSGDTTRGTLLEWRPCGCNVDHAVDHLDLPPPLSGREVCEE